MTKETGKDVRFSTDKQPSDEARIQGRGKRKIMTEALMISLNREVEGIATTDGKPTRRLTQIAEKLAEKAAEGDTQAIKEIFDRTEGKAAQALTLLGDEDNPLVTKIVTQIID